MLFGDESVALPAGLNHVDEATVAQMVHDGPAPVAPLGPVYERLGFRERRRFRYVVLRGA